MASKLRPIASKLVVRPVKPGDTTTDLLSIRCKACKIERPETEFDCDEPELRTLHDTCTDCWKAKARKGIEEKGLSHTLNQDLYFWMCKCSVEERMVLAEDEGFDITWVGLKPASGRNKMMAEVLIALSKGEKPLPIVPPEAKDYRVCTIKRHYALLEDFDEDRNNPGTLLKSCRPHLEANREISRKKYQERKAQNIPGGTPGTGANNNLVWCSSQVARNMSGHFVTKEEFGDNKTKTCIACRQKLKAREAKTKANAKRKRGLDPEEDKLKVDDVDTSDYVPPPHVQTKMNDLITAIANCKMSENRQGTRKCAEGGHLAFPDEFTINNATAMLYTTCERHRLLKKLNKLKIPGGTLITGGPHEGMVKCTGGRTHYVFPKDFGVQTATGKKLVCYPPCKKKSQYLRAD